MRLSAQARRLAIARESVDRGAAATRRWRACVGGSGSPRRVTGSGCHRITGVAQRQSDGATPLWHMKSVEDVVNHAAARSAVKVATAGTFSRGSNGTGGKAITGKTERPKIGQMSSLAVRPAQMPIRSQTYWRVLPAAPVARTQADRLVIGGEQVVLAIPLGCFWERVEDAVHIEEQQGLRLRCLANHNGKPNRRPPRNQADPRGRGFRRQEQVR